MLVDVLRECLTLETTAAPYFALSYVWGNAVTTTTTTTNLPALMQPGSLGQNSALPKTVADAISLTRKLGMRHLWVDCLCIVQDSPDKHRNIANMAVIYAQAELTIIAVSGRDADAGLPGVRPGTRRRRTMTRVQGDYTFALALPDDKSGLLDSTAYVTRGWTFQEMLLSKKLLFVTAHQVVFHCETSCRSESLPNEKPHASGHSENGIINLGHKDSLCDKSDKILESYNTIVSDYSKRRLSYQSDIENAFAGLACALEEWCEGSPVLHGMMSNTLGLSMMWYFPYSWYAPLERNSGRTSEPRREGFPSWSWVGWDRQIANFKSKIRSDFYLESLLSEVKIQSYSRGITSCQTLTVVDKSVKVRNCAELGQQVHITLEPAQLASSLPTSTLSFEAERTEWSNFTIDADLNLHFLKNAFVFSLPGEPEACGLLSIPLDGTIIEEVRNQTSPAVSGVWSLVRLYTLRLNPEDEEYDDIRQLRDEIEDREAINKLVERLPYPSHYCPSNLTLVFILLVRRHGQYWERVGSVMMYDDAWPSTSDQAKVRAYQERIVLV
jgi:hypothetical protein